MAKEKDEAPIGAFPVKGHRRARQADAVAARVARLHKEAPPMPQGVVALNAGFFALERIRRESVTQKKRAKKRTKARDR